MNILTDTLKLVDKEEGRRTFYLFRRKRAEQYGFALVVFRKRALIGYISSSDILVESDIQRRYDRLGIKDGDTILCVNLGPQRIKIAETLLTRDGWLRHYELELDLAVKGPIQFAQRYMEQTDPAQRAKTSIEGFIQYTAGRWDHDEINETLLREWAFQALTAPQNTISGLNVVAVHKTLLFMDQDREKEILSERQRKLENLQVHKEEQWHSQASFRREEEVKQLEHEKARTLLDLNEEAKRQETQKWESEMHKNWYEPIAEGTTPSSNPRIKEHIPGEKSMPRQAVSKPELRYLHARLPERVKAADKIPLQARVALLPTSNRSSPLRAFSIPPKGADLKLVLDCPGLLLHSASITTVHVTPTTDSDWVLFELEALYEGVYTLEILAFNGGAFLGTLSVQLTVDSLAMSANSVDCVTLLPLRSPQEGEVTLVIRYDPLSAVYRYQFRSTTFGETDELHSGPLQRGQEEAVADLVALLNEQARDLTEYSAEETRRWLQGKGVELWKELIPKELENLFWKQRENIKWMTILSAGDPMPWEMMYPTNDAGDDRGFLAEQFPIVRWIFGSAPTTRLQCSQPCFVIPDDAPPTAEDELAALRYIMGEGRNIKDLTPLLKLFDNAEFDSLHFACHNMFRPNSPTSSSIQLGSKRFVPTFLNKYNKHFHSPLIFMNACRSDGMAANYTWLAGWAKSFLDAGAGAFIGSLWEVRDSSASRFAETFYQALHSGIPLGDAMKQARTAIQNEPGDPTWLAYTLYGNPTAILLKEAPEVS